MNRRSRENSFFSTLCMVNPGKINLVAHAQNFARERGVQDGAFVIDATAGNGHDTLFLARLVGENGRVVAFDVQASAIAATRERLQKNGVADRVELFHCGHEKMADVLAPDWYGKVSAVYFNLGYLPRSNHEITTRPDTTLAALNAAWRLLAPGGFISLTIYTRHPGGFEESEKVNAWLETMRSRASVLTCGTHNPTEPWWVALVKTTGGRENA